MWVIFALLDPDPYPLARLDPDPIRIRIRNPEMDSFLRFLRLRLMRKDGWPAMCIHGDKQQKERDWVLGEFRSSAKYKLRTLLN